uniref:Uncharacterized protein n=1 Tax=Physcomitrium patens TaxID=3218 RepID=A0A2K1L3T9_PHYPA|nr:hypothetical protein PHYPA_003491 [Physcomitrium patens]
MSHPHDRINSSVFAIIGSRYYEARPCDNQTHKNKMKNCLRATCWPLQLPAMLLITVHFNK